LIASINNQSLPGIKRLVDKTGGVGVAYGGPDQREQVAYCHRCLDMANIRFKLGNRIYFPDSSGQVTIPPDYDLWRQCHRCGSIYARYEVKKEADISPFAEGVVSDNPFDFGNGNAVGVGYGRKFRSGSGSGQRSRRFKQNLSKYKEKDIQEALRKGAKLVSYHEDTAER
jgi:hypothetical protein